ncbi:uncharacterized protein LOC129599559 [Paramacrobiotus metropolitanus]|uniref:uncharacterized protein LOC129599559 n=2 Tax=Paramacrobiotus metropolitanus TaxID=2943436 RepID=UPI002445C17B|nr:uncharacterized protein LOC129599559 [Paramacrobiotus metropolitanus]
MAEQEQRSKRKMGPTEDSKKPATKLPQYFVDFASHSNVYNIKYRNRLAVDTTKYLNIQSDEWRTKTGKLVRKFQKSALDLAYIHHHQKAMFTAIIVILKKLLDVAQAMEKYHMESIATLLASCPPDSMPSPDEGYWIDEISNYPPHNSQKITRIIADNKKKQDETKLLEKNSRTHIGTTSELVPTAQLSESELKARTKAYKSLWKQLTELSNTVSMYNDRIKEHCLSLINGFEHLKSKLNIEKMTIAQEAFLPIVQEMSTVSTLIADRYLTQSENGRDVTAALNKLDIAMNLAKNALHGDHPEVRDDPRVDDVGESDSEMSTSDDD